MSQLEIRKGDLLEAEEQAICHQLNCKTMRFKGLADVMFKKWPWANPTTSHGRNLNYGSQYNPSPGEILVSANIKANTLAFRGLKKVINIYGQIYPGKPKYPTGPDSYKNRLIYFQTALDSMVQRHYTDIPGIGQELKLDSYAFPYGIGSGLAGGDFSKYLNLLEQFAEKMNVPVVLYKL